ncbi:MAG: crossover junction endodeoxyribonuclease RuvC [bacterium]
MIIIGIDPGTRRTGYAVIETASPTPHLLALGALAPSPRKPFQVRLLEIYRGIEEIVAEFRPDEMAIESVFVKDNVSAALKIGHMRGVALLVAALHGLEVGEYSPADIKQATVGSGAASKDQVQFMVTALMKLAETPSEDEADAIAVALCHSNRCRLTGTSEDSRVDILRKGHSC